MSGPDSTGFSGRPGSHRTSQRSGSGRTGLARRRRGLLEMEPGDPVLTMTRITYDKAGRPIEYGSHSYPAESYWFEMTLVEL